MEPLRLEPREQTQRLGVALEASDVSSDRVERALAVEPERRVPEVVRERRGVDDVGIAAERGPELPADLGDLERMRQPVADEVVAVGRDDLGLGREPAQRGRVDDASAVARELLPVRPFQGRILGDPAFAVRRVVGRRGHPTGPPVPVLVVAGGANSAILPTAGK